MKAKHRRGSAKPEEREKGRREREGRKWAGRTKEKEKGVREGPGDSPGWMPIEGELDEGGNNGGGRPEMTHFFTRPRPIPSPHTSPLIPPIHSSPNRPATHHKTVRTDKAGRICLGLGVFSENEILVQTLPSPNKTDKKSGTDWKYLFTSFLFLHRSRQYNYKFHEP